MFWRKHRQKIYQNTLQIARFLKILPFSIRAAILSLIPYQTKKKNIF